MGDMDDMDAFDVVTGTILLIICLIAVVRYIS